MSVGIQLKKVTDVLLADGWHKVIHGSFETYKLSEGSETCLPGGNGATFLEATDSNDILVCCPFTSILALKVFNK